MNRDRTRTAPAKGRTLTRRAARRMRIATKMAALLGVLAWGDDTATAPAFQTLAR